MSVRRERHGAVEVLTIDRPETMNAIDPATTRAFDEAFDELEVDDDVRAVILTGAGDRSFCSGVDLRIQSEEGLDGVISGKGGFAGIVQRNFSKPLIGAANGHALGGGLELLLACDIVVAADHAQFGSTEVTLGQLADGGSLIRLQNRVPLAIAAELVLTGARIDAHTAARWGLVNRVASSDDLLATALELAERIAQNSPRAVQLSKGLLYETLSVPDAEAWAINDRYSARMHHTHDWVEGPRAFIEHRAPEWGSDDA